MWFGIWATMILALVVTLIACAIMLWRKGRRTLRAVSDLTETLGESFDNPEQAHAVRKSLKTPRTVDTFGGDERRIELREQLTANRSARADRIRGRREETYMRWRAFNR